MGSLAPPIETLACLSLFLYPGSILHYISAAWTFTYSIAIENCLSQNKMMYRLVLDMFLKKKKLRERKVALFLLMELTGVCLYILVYWLPDVCDNGAVEKTPQTSLLYVQLQSTMCLLSLPD